MDKSKPREYIVREVGNYQLCMTYRIDGNKFIVPLNCMQEDSVVKSKSKKFLILKHAVITDLDFINFAMNTKSIINFVIFSNHEACDVNTGDDFRLEAKMNADLINMRLSNQIGRSSYYSLVFEINEINMKDEKIIKQEE